MCLGLIWAASMQVLRGPLDAAGLKEVDAVRYLATDVLPELFEENAKAITLVGSHVGGLIKAGTLSADNVRHPPSPSQPPVSRSCFLACTCLSDAGMAHAPLGTWCASHWMSLDDSM